MYKGNQRIKYSEPKKKQDKITEGNKNSLSSRIDKSN